MKENASHGSDTHTHQRGSMSSRWRPPTCVGSPGNDINCLCETGESVSEFVAYEMPDCMAKADLALLCLCWKVVKISMCLLLFYIASCWCTDQALSWRRSGPSSQKPHFSLQTLRTLSHRLHSSPSCDQSHGIVRGKEAMVNNFPPWSPPT